nr:hypothetical protein [Streptomyces malaysiense]
MMVAGYPSDAAENAVRSNVVSVGHFGETDVPNGPQGTVTGPGGECVDVAADDSGTNGADQHRQHAPGRSAIPVQRAPAPAPSGRSSS